MIRLTNTRVVCGKLQGTLEDGSEILTESIVRVDKNIDGNVIYTAKDGIIYMVESGDRK